MAERKVPVSYFDSLEHARTSLREESLQALEQQLGVTEWLRSSHCEPTLTHFVSSYGAQRTVGHTATARTAAWLRQELVGLVPDAPTYFVSRDMTEMVKMAAEDMPREGITPTDLLTDSGFLYFHHPIEIVGPALTIEEAQESEVDYNLLPVDRTERWQYEKDTT